MTITFFGKKNNALSKIATVGGIDGSTSPITFAVTTGEGAKFPASNFLISIDNEILLCTSRTGDNLTCTRNQESTSIAAHSQNADVEARITAAQLVEYENLFNGVSGGATLKTPTLQFPTFESPRGFLINGKIVPSVASNNLTVAIKGLDGNDPSTTNPVYCRIGDTVRSITAALSVTKNAGTNWFNAGSAELATKEIDYFVYLGYNATDGVTIGFSRIVGFEYDSFSSTTTDTKYCAISTVTNAAAGDDYEIIGRFAATLSAGAGYTWSVPTFTNKNLIQMPVYETRWLVWNPAYSASGSMTYTSVTTQIAYYKLRFDECLIKHNCYGTIGGTPNYEVFVTLPFSSLTNGIIDIPVTIYNNSLNVVGYFRVNTANLSCRTSADANWTAGRADVRANFSYIIL